MFLAETADDVLDALDEYAKGMKVLPRYWDTTKNPVVPPSKTAPDGDTSKKPSTENIIQEDGEQTDLGFFDRRAR